MKRPNKKYLLQELAAIEEQENAEMIAKNYPILKKKYLGKYFKTENSFGSHKPGWWLYSKVTQLRPEDVYDTGSNSVTAHCQTVRFQTDCDGNVSVDVDKFGHAHSLGQQITKREFDAAYRKMLKIVQSVTHSS